MWEREKALLPVLEGDTSAWESTLAIFVGGDKAVVA